MSMTTRNTFWLAIVFALLGLASLQAHAAAAADPDASGALTVNRYLDQVRGGNTAFQGSEHGVRGASERLDEGDLLVSLQAFGNASFLNDQAFHPLSGSQLITNSYTLGVQEQTAWGLGAKLYYASTYTAIYGLNPQFAGLFPTQYSDSKPVVEVTFPLWRNLFGSETRSLLEANRAANEATADLNRLQLKEIVAQAETAYWRMALAREAVRVQQETFDRSQKMRDWAARRAHLGLGEQSDLLQAEAVLKLRRIELQGAQDELRSASRAFNTARGTDGDAVPEALEGLSALVESYGQSIPQKDGVRDDVKAAQAQARAAAANSKAVIERNRPTVDAFGSVALNGHGDDFPTSASNSFTTANPTTAVGVRLNFPLNFGLVSQVKQGYEDDIEAADLKAQRTAFETDTLWADLNQRYKEARRRLSLAREVEEIQREKFSVERQRHQRGKSTTFLVLQFEQDYYTAQLNRLRMAGDLLGVVSQLKTFAK